MLRVLVVGAGAVGQVYALHLARGGARVTFRVRRSHVASLAGGLRLYPLERGAAPVLFREYDVSADDEDLPAGAFDQVWLCVSSTALGRGDWFEDLARGTGDATIVALQPGLTDRAFLVDRVDEGRLVQGAIALVSYPCPLPAEAPRPAGPGVAFYFPPGPGSPFQGPAHRVQGVVDALRLGGCPATHREDTTLFAARASSIMMPVIAGLEQTGWSLAALRASVVLETSAAAARQALAVTATYLGHRPPAFGALVRASLLRLALPFAPRAVPFPLEAYLRFHFEKVGDQTRAMLTTYIEQGTALRLPVDALVRLRRGLGDPTAAAPHPAR